MAENHFQIIGLPFKLEDDFKDYLTNLCRHPPRQAIERNGQKFNLITKPYGHGLSLTVVTNEQGQLMCAWPAFKARHETGFQVSKVFPEACGNEGILVGGPLGGEHQPALAFSIANFLESKAWQLKDGDKVKARLAGFCYSLEAFPPKSEKKVMAEGPMEGKSLDFGLMGFILPARQDAPAENTNYAVRGEILAFEEFKNEETGEKLVWLEIDTKAVKLELLVNRKHVQGKPKKGDYAFARAWLQGFITATPSGEIEGD